jgi:hypothetical protein
VVPFASPLTVSGLLVDAGDRVVQVIPPFVEYCRLLALPLKLKAIDADRFPGVAEVIVGAVRSAIGDTAPEEFENRLSPAAEMAATL